MSTQHVISSNATAGLPEGHESELDDDDPDEEASFGLSSQSQEDALPSSHRGRPATSTVAKLTKHLRKLKSAFSFNTGSRPRQSQYKAVSSSDERSTTATHSPGFFNARSTTIWTIICHSYTNTLLVFVPVGIATYLANVKTPVVFTSNAVAIIPLSSLLTYATENIARDAGDTVGALVNITFGNLAEVIMFVALHNDQIRVVQASLLGSMLVNLLLILGTAILAGAAFQDHEQLHNRNEAQALACLLCVSVFSMMTPNAFYHSFNDKEAGKAAVLKFSRACAVILIVVYGLYLVFQLRSTALKRGQVRHNESNPNFSLNHSQRNSVDSTPHLVPRSIRFEEAERQGSTDDAMSASNKSFELDELDEPGRSLQESDDESSDTGNMQPVKDQDRKPRPPPKYRADNRDSSETRSRRTIYQRHGRGRSSNSVQSPRDRSLSAARSASSYSRIFLGSQSTENLPTLQAPEPHLTSISKSASAILLIISSLLVAVCAEFLISTVDDMVRESALSEAFIGLIILPIVGNCAEHITAVTVAMKNKLDLAIGVSVGSAVQVSLVLTPLIVLVGWALNKEMTMYFNLFETVTLVATAFLVNFLILNGRTNFLEGSLLCACYVIISVGAYLFPNPESETNV